jgi:hypothetical protein
MMTKCNKLLFLTGLVCLPGMSAAATAVYDNFDAGLGSWIPNTTQTTITHSPAGGNPNGYLHTDNTSSPSTSFGAIGATNATADYSGVFADGFWTISLDLSSINGDFTDSWLRFRYQDATANGWHISLEDTDFFSNPWQSYTVSFDTTWDDATAIANGWVKETDGMLTATPSFSGLWDNVYTSEVRILGTSPMVAGIDNYRTSLSTPAVPVPAAVWLFSSGLLALAGVARRRKN